jgi:DNA-directed RNA polymerase specialized sigma24 family protein
MDFVWMICCSTSAVGGIMIGMEIVTPPATLAAAASRPLAAPDDGDVFSTFYNEHSVAATRLAWLLTHDRSSCEDISHEAFALVLPRFASLEDPAAYLRRVIINRVAERNRRSSRERVRIDFITAGQPLVEDGPTGGLIDAISVLPMNQRTAVVLRYWVDLNHIQIADAMGIRPGTVRSLLSRATATLRKDITS